MAVCDQITWRVNRNRDFKETFAFTDCDGNPKDLTGFNFVLELRKTVNAPDPTLLTLTSSPAAGITVLAPATNGKIEVVITDTQSATLPSGVFPFDLYQITTSGDKETVVSGYISSHDSTAI